MEGMIQKADKVLDRATKTDRDGALRRLFEKSRGIILISVVEGALLVSGAAGVGIMMVKDPDETWSPPCACGMVSTSMGFAVGAVIKDVIIFALDEKSVRDFTTKVGLKLGVGTSVTLGTVGTNVGANVNLTPTGTSSSINVNNLGVGGTVSIAFSQGAYVSASISGAVVGPRDMVNQDFYESPVTANDILFGDVDIPKDKFSPVLGDVYDKLDMLSEGSPGAFVPKEVQYNDLFTSNFLSAVSLILQGVTEEVLKTLEEEKKEEEKKVEVLKLQDENKEKESEENTTEELPSSDELSCSEEFKDCCSIADSTDHSIDHEERLTETTTTETTTTAPKTL